MAETNVQNQKQAGEAKMGRVVTATAGWTKVGKTAREKLQTLTTRLQGALKEEMGQQKEWQNKPTMQPKNEKIKKLREEAATIRKLLGNTPASTQKEWFAKEKERCEKIEKGRTTSEQMTVDMCKDPMNAQIKWVMNKRWEAIKHEAQKEEERLLLEHWKQRDEVKKAGAEYTPWATYMWKQGKQVSMREPDILVLEEADTQEMKVGEGMKQVMKKYMQTMWGTEEKLAPVK